MVKILRTLLDVALIPLALMLSSRMDSLERWGIWLLRGLIGAGVLETGSAFDFVKIVVGMPLHGISGVGSRDGSFLDIDEVLLVHV